MTETDEMLHEYFKKMISLAPVNFMVLEGIAEENRNDLLWKIGSRT